MKTLQVMQFCPICQKQTMHLEQAHRDRRMVAGESVPEHFKRGWAEAASNNSEIQSAPLTFEEIGAPLWARTLASKSMMVLQELRQSLDKHGY
jgi:hypothetical protein